MNKLVSLANRFLFEKTGDKRELLLHEFDKVSREDKINNPELTNLIIRILSLPYSSEVKSKESEIAKDNYSHGGKILSQGQIEVLNHFLYTNGRKEVWVNAPTSWGKTLVASAIIFRKNYKKIAFIVPSIFLMNEVYDIFRKSEWEGDIRIFAEEEKSEKFIHILTPERFNHSKEKYDFIIYDEFYKVSDNQSKIKNEFEINGRGFTFRKAFAIARNSSADLLMLSPWIKINSKSNWYESYMKRIKLFDFVNPIAYSNTFQKIIQFDGDFKKYIATPKTGVSLLFADSYPQLKKLGEYIVETMPEVNDTNTIENLFRKDATFHKSLLSKLIKRGVVVIGATLPRFLLIEIADFIRKNPNKIKFILSTSSISEGVNLPIDNIFIHKLSVKPTSFDLKNLFGRAGRFRSSLEISAGNVFVSEKIMKILEKKDEFSYEPNIDDVSEVDLSNEDREKMERLNNILSRANLLDENKNLISELSFARKEDIVNIVEKINNPEIVESFSKLRWINEGSNTAEIFEVLSVYNKMIEIIFGNCYSEKQIKAFSGILATGIYSSQIRSLQNMSSADLLNKVRFEFGHRVSLIENIYKRHNEKFDVLNSGYITTFATTKKRAVQNDFGLPKSIEKSKDPFVEKYKKIVEEMID